MARPLVAPLAWAYVLVLAVTLVAVAAAPPSHAMSCGPLAGNNYHMGYNTNASSTSITNIFGVRISADVQNPKLCSGGSNNFAAVYAMLKGGSGSCGYMQVGYIKSEPNSQNAGLRHFAEHSYGCGPGQFYTWYGGATLASGNIPDYKVMASDQAPAISNVYSYVNGGGVLDGGTSNWGSYPWYIEISGEARYAQDDVPGISTNRVNLDQLKYYNRSVYTFVDMPSGIFTTVVQSSRWHLNSVSSTHKQFWSDPTN